MRQRFIGCAAEIRESGGVRLSTFLPILRKKERANEAQEYGERRMRFPEKGNDPIEKPPRFPEAACSISMVGPVLLRRPYFFEEGD
jgi:hypothetical protein